MQNSKVKFIGIVFVVIGTVAVLYLKDTFFDNSGTMVQVEQAHGPQLAVSPLEYDFGTVRQSGGIVSAVFDVYNDGNEAVVITDAIASCSCTSATMDKMTLVPGERGKLTVSFDPNYHYEDEERFFRTVVLKSNVSGDAPEVKIWVQVDYDLGKDKLKFPGKGL